MRSGDSPSSFFSSQCIQQQISSENQTRVRSRDRTWRDTNEVVFAFRLLYFGGVANIYTDEDMKEQPGDGNWVESSGDRNETEECWLGEGSLNGGLGMSGVSPEEGRYSR